MGHGKTYIPSTFSDSVSTTSCLSSSFHLRTTSHTQMHIRKFRFDKIFNKLQDLLAGGWPPREVWAFIESVNNDINWALPRKIQHIRQAVFERINMGLS